MVNDYYKILNVTKSNTTLLKKNLIGELELIKTKKGSISEEENKHLHKIIMGFYILSIPYYKEKYDQVLLTGEVDSIFKAIEQELDKKASVIVKNLKEKYGQSESGIGDVFAFLLEITANLIP